jgi:hypothetical protein
MNGISQQPIKNVRMKDVFFTNVDSGADFCRIKELTLDNVNIDSKGRPIDLEDVSEVSIKNVALSGEKPLRPIQIRGAKSGAIRIEGLDPDKVECASDVPQNGIQILNCPKDS